jgi:hypothetical protein
MLCRLTIERADDDLCLFRGLVNGPIAVVDDLFRMAERPTGIDAVGLMSGISRRRGIAGLECRCEAAEIVGVFDGAGKCAVADALILSVPAGGREPHFEFDVRVPGGRDDALHTAERRQRDRLSGRAWLGRKRKRTRRNRLRLSDRRVAEGQRLQIGARRGRAGTTTRKPKRQNHRSESTHARRWEILASARG